MVSPTEVRGDARPGKTNSEELAETWSSSILWESLGQTRMFPRHPRWGKAFSRLARSTCCQRPNRGPPERRVSVESGSCASAIACPRNLLHPRTESREGENPTNLAWAAAACQRYEPRGQTGATTPVRRSTPDRI